MYEAEVSAALPFPLRVGHKPYSVKAGKTRCLLTIERQQHKHPDERLGIEQGDFDLEHDRSGLASYSLVRARLRSSVPIAEPVVDFLLALNLLIEHVRDLFGIFWIRRVEESDLAQLRVRTSGGTQASVLTAGRAGGITLPVAGLRDEAEQALRARLEGETRPPTWRMLQLDAHEARATGRYSEAVLLGWTALEAACRQNLPMLAATNGLTPTQLKERLRPRDSKRGPFLSGEEVVEWASSLNCIEATAELAPVQAYHPDSLSASVRRAYDIRNRVVHQGARIGAEVADEALAATDFVLWALGLSQLAHTSDNDPLQAWRSHFGRVHPQVRRWAGRRGGRVILFNAARANRGSYTGEWWNLGIVGDDYFVYVATDMPEPIAATLLLSMHDVFVEESLRRLPTLRATEGALFVTGLKHGLVRSIQQSVLHSRALLKRRGHGLPVCGTSTYALGQILKRVARGGLKFSPDDVRHASLSARFAAYLVLVDCGDRARFMKAIGRHNPSLAELTARWTDMFGLIDPRDDHSLCPVLRHLHGTQPWLDSIVVDCPIEEASFGTLRRPLGQPR
jgi:hypothetical protein